MATTDNFIFPDDSELIVPEIKLSYPILQSAAVYLGKYCESYNNEFSLCRTEERDPRRCLKEGRDVTNCAFDFFKKLKANCRDEFERYSYCIEQSSPRGEYKYCRQTQEILDKCMLEKLDIERPSYGYFCETKVIDTKRPQPAPYHEYKRPEDAVPVFDSTKVPLPEAKYFSRRFWQR